MKNMLLNHDCFNTWQTCRRKYYYKYIKELKLPEFHEDYELGKSVHALIDYHLRGLKTAHLLENASSEVINCWNSIKTNPIFDKKVIATEWSFNCAFSSQTCWLIGRIDAIFFDEEKNKYIIADWKTGKFIPKKIDTNFQHKLYLYAFYQSRKDLGLDFEPKNLCFQYFKILPDSVEITEIDFSEENLLEYEKTFAYIIKKMESIKEISKQDSCPDKYCQYKGICGC